MEALDPKLIERARKGDKEAYGAIYKFYLSRIYRFALYLVSDEALAEDLTQEAFIKTWNYLPRFDNKKGTVQALLFTTTRNLVIDYQRKRKEERIPEDGESFLGGSDDVAESYVSSEQMESVRKSLSVLPKDDREVIILRYFEDMSFTEIAGVIGKEEGALRVQVHRALKILKNELSK